MPLSLLGSRHIQRSSRKLTVEGENIIYLGPRAFADETWGKRKCILGLAYSSAGWNVVNRSRSIKYYIARLIQINLKHLIKKYL